MRPVFLDISAFGAYADRERIDLTRLEGQPLLLIHGPTGSGKSTVLDAICFALFGTTSGSERTGAQMRSEFAEVDRLTEITYDFEFRGREYRVRRSPGQQRPKARGKGMTTHSPTAGLWDRTDVPRDQDGAHLVSGADPVRKRVEKLFGFNAQQFRQVVMLPQGQFRLLLMAKSDEKETILRALFGTDLYGRVARELVDRANRLRGRYQERATAAATLLGHSGHQTADGLEQAASDLSVKVEALQQKIEERTRSRDARRASLEQAVEVQRKLAEAATATSRLEALAGRKLEFARRREALTAARRALPLIDMVGQVDARGREAREAAGARVRAEGKLAKAQRAAAEAKAVLEAETLREPERESSRREVARLEGLRQRVADLAAAEEALTGARDTLERSRSRLDAAGSRHDELAGLAATREEERRRLEELASQAQAAELKLAGARERVQRAEAFDAAKAKVAGARGVAAEAEGKEAKASEALGAAQRELKALRGRWRDGQAAVLARSLTDGEACPVCGATEHPAPAAGGAETPSDGDIDRAQSRVDRCEVVRTKAVAAHEAAAARLEAAVATAVDLQQALGSDADAPRDELSRDAARLQEALAESTRATAALPLRVKELEGMRGGLERGLEEVRQLEEGVGSAEASGAAALAIFEERAGEVPESLREPGRLATELAAAGVLRDDLLGALNRSRTAAGQAAEELASAKSALERVAAAAGKAVVALEDARSSLAARREAAGLTDDAAFGAACASVPSIERTEADLRDFDSALAAATDRARRAKEAAAGLQAQDVPALEASLTALETDRTALVGSVGECRSQHKELTRLLLEHRETLAEAESLERRHRVLGGVAEVARGRGRNQRNMSFQRFVLAVLLDDVLLQASVRLRRMTEDRYELVRSTQVAHKGQASGLDLEVRDVYSGKTRSVATLSGGESFLAALSLSLGLVDVVQGYSGGVQLDALFIDEGFGTLDSESLERAIDVLKGLNRSGRLIGLISHVAELRERIGTRLEVIPKDRGSRTELVVG